MKTVLQALRDEVHYPIPIGYIENILIKRELDGTKDVDKPTMDSDAYKGAVADCLYSLVGAIQFSESDKSIGTLTDEQRKLILKRANKLYGEIGEPTFDDGEPTVTILD